MEVIHELSSSVVIASYNGERFITEQLESIVHQTLLPSEIIISDDGSTDRTVELVRLFIDEHESVPVDFKLVFNESGNHGVAPNFANALSFATGKYVFFCDQDDIWFDNKIERMLSVMETCCCKVAIHNGVVMKENIDGTFSTIDRHLLGSLSFDSEGIQKLRGEWHVWSALHCCYVQGMCICAEREYLMSILPFSFGNNHDYWILLCGFADGVITAVSDDLVFYRIHNGNTCGISAFKHKRSLLDRIATFDKKGKESIIKQYAWYVDTADYIDGRYNESEQEALLYRFFTNIRIKALAKSKVTGTIELIKAYKSGAYKIDGKILFAHDLIFVWLHFKKYRKAFLQTVYESPRKRKLSI